jgi:hypothetical protein
MNPEVTQLLNALEQGDPHAAEELLPLVYQELRKLAARRMAQEQPGQTLQHKRRRGPRLCLKEHPQAKSSVLE